MTEKSPTPSNEESSRSKLQRSVWRMAFMIGLTTILYFGRPILLPLTVAGLIAVLLNPIDAKLRAWGWKPVFSIGAALMVLVLLFGGLAAVVGAQAVRLSDDWPEIEERIVAQIETVRSQVPGLENLGDSADSVSSGPPRSGSALLQSLPFEQSALPGMVTRVLGSFGNVLLLLVYITLFLAEKERLKQFVLRRAPKSREEDARHVLHDSMDVAQRYLKGRMILVVILAVLYGGGFWFLDVEYALVVALLAAVLSIIPFLGNIVGGGLAMAIGFASGGDMMMLLGIFVTMSVAQILESYVLTPLIVGDEVDLNPLTTVVAVIAFSVLWGPMGAIVAIPVIAILCVAFREIDGMEDYAYLLGQE